MSRYRLVCLTTARHLALELEVAKLVFPTSRIDKVWEQFRHSNPHKDERIDLEWGHRAARIWLSDMSCSSSSQKLKIAVKPARRLATVLFRSTYAKRQTRNPKETRRTLLFSCPDVSKLCAWIDLPLFIEDIEFSFPSEKIFMYFHLYGYQIYTLAGFFFTNLQQLGVLHCVLWKLYFFFGFV